MCKILLVGDLDQDLDLKDLLGNEDHDLIKVTSAKEAKEQVLNNGYFDMVLAAPCDTYEKTTEILQHVRQQSNEAHIIVILDKDYSYARIWEWVKTLSETVGVDAFVPENNSHMIKIAITNAATRMKQRSLSPQFDELANKILDKLS